MDTLPKSNTRAADHRRARGDRGAPGRVCADARRTHDARGPATRAGVWRRGALGRPPLLRLARGPRDRPAECGAQSTATRERVAAARDPDVRASRSPDGGALSPLADRSARPRDPRAAHGTGLRLGEAVRIDVTDLDLRSGLLLVRNGKGRKDRANGRGRRRGQPACARSSSAVVIDGAHDHGHVRAPIARSHAR
jgi:hypothetical protein